ncbi:MAG: hypothetical protein ACYCZJ_13580, partial [Sulfuriferula sp.]
MPVRQTEQHRTQRIGWLRAAVLGANDGIVSTASLVLGKLCKTPTFAPRTRTHCVNIEPMKQTTLNLDLSLKRTRKRE